MNLKVLFFILIYYSILSGVFLMGGSVFAEEMGFSINGTLNASQLSEDEIDSGGLFGTGVSFGRFVSLVTIGIGLPSDTPTWFMFFFALWQTIFTIFSIGFVISSIWDG